VRVITNDVLMLRRNRLGGNLISWQDCVCSDSPKCAYASMSDMEDGDIKGSNCACFVKKQCQVYKVSSLSQYAITSEKS
jgi:hypothetical protein